LSGQFISFKNYKCFIQSCFYFVSYLVPDSWKSSVLKNSSSVSFDRESIFSKRELDKNFIFTALNVGIFSSHAFIISRQSFKVRIVPPYVTAIDEFGYQKTTL